MNGPDAIGGGAPPPPEAERAALRQAAQTFEALLVQMMVRAMRRAQLQEGLFGKGAGSDVYEGWFDRHLSERLAGGSPFGIARALEESWTRDPSSRPPAPALREVAARAAAEYRLVNTAKDTKTFYSEGDSPARDPQVPASPADENRQERVPAVEWPPVRLRAREGRR